MPSRQQIQKRQHNSVTPTGRQTSRAPQPAASTLATAHSRTGLYPHALHPDTLHPDTLTPADVLQLQRTAGNQAVQRLLAGQPDSSAPRQARRAPGARSGGEEASCMPAQTSAVPQVSRVATPQAGLIQRGLMDLTTFKNQKDLAANKKGKVIKTTRSSKDYKKSYEKYQKALREGRLNEALATLQEIDDKVGRMRNKTYWKSDHQRDTFLNQVTQGVTEERLLVDKRILDKNVKDKFEDSGSFRTDNIKDQRVTDNKDYWVQKQRYMMVVDALKIVREEVPQARAQVMDPQLIQQVDGALPTPTTFIDVYNEIANNLAALAPTTRANMILAISQGNQSPQEKAIAVARALWGNFEWKTKGTNDFRDWATGANNNARGEDATMNCWEAVLEIMLQAGLVPAHNVRQVYGLQQQGNSAGYFQGLLNLLGWNGAPGNLAYANDDWTGNLPPAGSVIFYESGRPPSAFDQNTLEHVVLSLGQNQAGKTEVMSLWNAATGGSLGKATMEQLLGNSIEYISFS